MGFSDLRLMFRGARTPLTGALVLAATVGGIAWADARSTAPIQGVGTQCLDTLGAQHAPVCQTQNASRISVDPDICVCAAGLREVQVPYCEVGETPPPQSKAADAARALAAKSGSLAGASFEGRRFCEPQGRTGG